MATTGSEVLHFAFSIERSAFSIKHSAFSIQHFALIINHHQHENIFPPAFINPVKKIPEEWHNKSLLKSKK